MKDTFRRLRVRARERLESLRPSSDEVESSGVEGQVASDRISTDSRQQHSEITRQEHRVDIAAELRDTSESTSQLGTNPSPIENIDGSSWANVWPEAYQNIKTDPEHSELVQKLERFLESESGRLGADDVELSDDPSGTTDESIRLKTIQKNAEERLGSLSDAHLSFKLRDKPIVVRESILKVVQVINTLKPIIGGAVAAEPSAALAWASVTTILPMLENIFQQDEDAATGLTNIIFLMARYQGFHERDFASQLASPSESGVSRELLSHIRNELASVYSKIYVYEARFILQYGKRNKAHRALRNALSADDWKKAWSEIESISNLIDNGVTAQVNAATLETWQVVKDVQEHVARFEAMQNDFDRRQLLLSLQVTGNATYDSYRSSKVANPCLRGTQRHILQTIQEWTENSQGEMILWLEGMAGTGKTSVSLTVASALEARKPFTDTLERASNAFLGASFFFSQGDTTRNNTFEFFRTIAWCLADVSPEFGKLVTDAIKDNPGIHTKVPLQQLQKLIVGPLKILDKSTFVPLCLVVVIDALDECDKNDAQELLGMLFHLQNLHQIQLRFLITSRYEEHIATSFVPTVGGLSRRIQLNKIKSATDEKNDIVYYLSETLKEIAKAKGVPDDGVSNSDIMKLTEKADGLFIYAATACRFLEPDFAHRTLRDEHLALIFDGEIEEEGPQYKVDGIYFKVLAFPDIQKFHKRLQATFYAYISRLIGFIVVLFRPASVETLFHLLQASTEDMTHKTEETAKGDLDRYLRRLHSIVNVPEKPGFPLSLVHLSFRDFILNQRRSERLPFSIDELSMHREVLHRCFALMNSKLRENICCLNLPGSLVSEVDPSHISYHIPQYLQYACRYWVDHLLKADRKFLTHTMSEDTEGPSSAGLVYRFLKEKLLYWLEVMAFIREASSIIPMFNQLEKSIELSTDLDLLSLLRDAKRFVANNQWIIEHTPLQVYCSALLFCPKESLVRFYYQNMIPLWIKRKPQTQQAWPAGISTLEGHTGRILDTAFSPTETLLASVSGDNTTRVWDYITGSEKYRFEDPGRPLRVCFSADGSKLASGCLDGMVHVRDLRTGKEASFHSTYYVEGLLFSPISCNVLASISQDGPLRVWSIDDRRLLIALELRTAPLYKKIAFSPDGKLVAVYARSFVALYDIEQGQLVYQYPLHNLKDIRGLSISTDHRTVAVRFDESVEFWEFTSLNPTVITYETTWSDNSLLLFISPDEKIKMCQTHTEMVDVFDLAKGDSIGTFLKSFVKHDSHGKPLRADKDADHRLIRILSGSSTSKFGGGEGNTPDSIRFLYGNMALSFSSGMETRQWNVIDGSMEVFEDHVLAVTFSPDRQFVILQLNRGNEFQVWDQNLTQKIAVYEQLAYMDFVPQTGHLVSLSLLGNLRILRQDPKSLTFETVNNFSLPSVYFKSIPEMNAWVAKPLYVSPNGEVVAVILDGYNTICGSLLQLWNVPRQERIKEIHYDSLQRIIFSPQSNYVVVEDEIESRCVDLLHLSNGTKVEGCDLDDGELTTFHPSGQMFGIVSNVGRTISIWKDTPWLKHFMFQVPEEFHVTNLAFSTTNKLVVLSKSYDRGSVIDTWDTSTSKRIGSQNMMFTGFAFSLCFSKNEKFLESSRGRLPVLTEDATDMGLESPSDGIHNCLYVLDDWVYQGRERLIWLPPSYRPPTYQSRNIDVQGDTVAIAYEGNSVKFIGVSLEETPVAMHYLGRGSR